ncbi:prefoldin subunit beta [Nanoarchaeota archaeon]
MSEKETINSQEKINQLQLMEQSMQNTLMQKQNFQAQLMEIESALSELEKTDKAYKIIGNIMVASEKESLKKDLNDSKEKIDLRLKAIEKQEEKLKERAKKTQQEVLDEMKKKDK